MMKHLIILAILCVSCSCNSPKQAAYEPIPFAMRAETEADPIVLKKLVLVTYPPTCPPCRKLEQDDFISDWQTAFQCPVIVVESEENRVPYLECHFADGSGDFQRVYEFYESQIESREHRLAVTLGAIAQTILNHEGKQNETDNRTVSD